MIITKNLVVDNYILKCLHRIVKDWLFGDLFITTIFISIVITLIIYYHVVILHDYFTGHTSEKKLG